MSISTSTNIEITRTHPINTHTHAHREIDGQIEGEKRQTDRLKEGAQIASKTVFEKQHRKEITCQINPEPRSGHCTAQTQSENCDKSPVPVHLKIHVK